MARDSEGREMAVVAMLFGEMSNRWTRHIARVKTKEAITKLCNKSLYIKLNERKYV